MKLPHRLNAIALTLALACSIARAGVPAPAASELTKKIIVLSGNTLDAATGAPVGSKWSSFGIPSISSAGDVDADDPTLATGPGFLAKYKTPANGTLSICPYPGRRPTWPQDSICGPRCRSGCGSSQASDD